MTFDIMCYIYFRKRYFAIFFFEKEIINIMCMTFDSMNEDYFLFFYFFLFFIIITMYVDKW